MKERSKQTELKKEFRRLFRAMDFISSRFKEGTRASEKDIRAYHEVYQVLGYAWEFLSLQCHHRGGYKKTRSENDVCRICGTVKGVEESHLLLPRFGPKRIGLKKRPDSENIFSSKRKAQIIKDSIVFHGATLDVDVHNAYKSWLGRIGKPINITADRIITLKERGVKCSVDDFMISVELPAGAKSSREPEYGGFPWEIKRDHLKKFPILFRFNKGYKLLGLSILSGAPRLVRKRTKKTSLARNP